ncbi:thiol reductant ABC exporter CydC subunit [Kineosphaera limosa]|uniref:ABC transporter permease/ATP-binding protein CydC n=1 Tax=Kineosphaera limosa NBRC 100340 TaxID=1184609 RepID=K6WX89_9MICO|nr:thiol reductant ABC exporter subunit CydC [Kineosphaera limosa]NYE01550.1 thiol reductant ABC exporter CydC subunit [Kineosphaera limosa]GAB96707.1 ABC transporter permease/ATP-binding protein CydC [Kineosphaera limosa NBRC 100340]
MTAAAAPNTTPGGPADQALPSPAEIARWNALVPGVRGASLLGTFALLSGVALTATSGWLIVAASFQPQILTLLAAIVLVRAFGMARPALRYAERLRSHDAALGYLARQREAVYRALIPLTPARLGRRGRADVLAGVVDDLDDLAFAQVRVIVPLVSMVGAGLLAALLVSLVLVPAALIVLALVLACLLVGVLGWWLEARAQARIVAARAQVTRWSTLVATRPRDIAAVGGASFVLARLAQAQQQLTRALAAQGRGRAVGVALTPLLTIAATAAVCFVVAPWVADGMPTPIAAMIVLVPVALADVVGVVPDAVGALARAQAASRRLHTLLEQEPAVAQAAQAPVDAAEVDPAPRAITMADTQSENDNAGESESESESAGDIGTDAPGSGVAVDLHDVTARWAAQRPALAAVDLTLRPGEAVTITGANGSGKSTLLAVLARQLDPDSGRYDLAGSDALAQPLEHTRAQIAVVDDEVHIFASTLRENLRLAAPAATDEQIVAAIGTAGLAQWLGGLPDGLDTPLGATRQGVSGGERARLGIARAVLSGRPLVLLDEPVAHLDHPTAQAVLADLARAASGRSLALVSHREETLPGARELRLR